MGACPHQMSVCVASQSTPKFRHFFGIHSKNLNGAAGKKWRQLFEYATCRSAWRPVVQTKRSPDYVPRILIRDILRTILGICDVGTCGCWAAAGAAAGAAAAAAAGAAAAAAAATHVDVYPRASVTSHTIAGYSNSWQLETTKINILFHHAGRERRA